MSRKVPVILRPLLPSGVVLRLRLPKPCSSAGVLPFFREPAHKRSARSLYRSLLRAVRRFDTTRTVEPLASVTCSSSGRLGLPGVEKRLKERWRKKRQLTSLSQVTSFLDTQASLLSLLQSSIPEDRSTLLSLDSRQSQIYSRLAARTAYFASLPRPKPRLTGSYLRPTLFNPPLPRLKPQPEGVSMMIHNRLRARERRIERRNMWAEWAADMKHEVAFLRRVQGLGRRESGRGVDQRVGKVWLKGPPGAGEEARGKVGMEGEKDPWIGGWDWEMHKVLRGMDEAFEREKQRSEMVFESGMIKRVERARARRDEWRREKARRREEQVDQDTAGKS